MADHKFAAEMEALAASRFASRRKLTGDGKAIDAPSFMDFGGPRVTIKPDKLGRHALPNALPSARHVHDDECLKPVAGGLNLTREGGELEVPEPDWFECSHSRVRYHLHGETRMAHWSRDRSMCPVAAPVPA